MEDNTVDNVLKRKLERELYHECKKVRKTVETNDYYFCDVKGEYSKNESGFLKSFLSKDAVHQLRSDLVNERIHKSTNDGNCKDAFLQREGEMAHCSLPDAKLQDIKCASYTPSSIFNSPGSKVDKLDLIFTLPAKINNYSHSVEKTAADLMAHHVPTISQESGHLEENGKTCFIFDKNMDYENRRVLKSLHLDPDVSYSLGGMLPPLMEKVEEEENEAFQDDDALQRKQLSTDLEIVEHDGPLIRKTNFPLDAILFKLPTLGEHLLSFKGDILDNGRVVICMSNDTTLDAGDHSLNSISTCKRYEQSFHANNIEVNGWNKTEGSSLEITEITSDESEVEIDENGNYLTTCFNGDVHKEVLDEDTIEGIHDDRSYGKFTENCEHVVATTDGVMDVEEESTLCSRMKSLLLGSKVPSKASMKENAFRKLWEEKTCNKRNKVTSRPKFYDQVTINLASDSVPAKESVSEVKSNLESMLFPFEDTDVKNGIVSSLRSWEERFQNLEQYAEHGKPENVLEEWDGTTPENSPVLLHYYAASPNDSKSLAEEMSTEESLMEDKNSYNRNNDEDINSDDHMVPSTSYAFSSYDYYQHDCQSFKPIRVGLSRKRKVAASLHPYLSSRKKQI